jgi:hypothetical protein
MNEKHNNSHASRAMAYNHRMSQQFHGSQQPHGRSRKKEDENDALMRLVSPLPMPETGRVPSDHHAARQRNRRMYQRYWDPIYHGRPGQT